MKWRRWRIVLELLLVAVIVGELLFWAYRRTALTNKLTDIRTQMASAEDRRDLACVEEGTSIGDSKIEYLIFALGEPDIAAAFLADQSLRRISHTEEGFGDVALATPDQRVRIAQQWIDWYFSRKTNDGE